MTTSTLSALAKRVGETAPSIPKKVALLEILALIDERAPTDADGNPSPALSPQEYHDLLSELYTLAADALGIALQ